MNVGTALLVMAATIASAAQARAQAIASYATVVGEVAFDGHGTLGDFTGRTARITGRLVGAPSIEGVRGWVEADARSLATGNGRRDRDMRSSLETEKYPTIRFDLDAIGAGTPSGDSIPVTLRGRFTIHGVTRESAVRGWVRLLPDRVAFRGRAPMTITDYGIGGLSKALGLLKMNKDVVVWMELVWSKS